MRIEVSYASENPSNDDLVIWRGHDRLARIDAQTFLDLLGPKQQQAWLKGQFIFNIKAGALRDASRVNYMRF